MSKVVFVGGGSYAWSPRIVKDMLLTEQLSGSTFVLYDTNLSAAKSVRAFLNRLPDATGHQATIVATDQCGEAFDGADYFVVTISTGGLDAMAHDLIVPEEYGIYHTTGDTSGPGGWARLMRNFSVFEELAEAFNRYAPAAPVLNYTNPLTPLTDVLSRSCTAPVVGLCHGLFENISYLSRIYGVEESQLSLNYGGVNHFFWITEAKAPGIDVLADLHGRVQEHGLTRVLAEAFSGSREAPPVRELATALFRETGVMPYFGDRHTAEFYAGYITDLQVMAELQIERKGIAGRRKQLADDRQRVESLRSGPIPDQYLVRSRETAADIIAAHSSGRSFFDVGNTPNAGQISNLPRGAVVETAVRVDARGFTPLIFGDLPATVLPHVERWCRVFTLAVDACMARDRQAALQALQLDPVCSHLTAPRVREMGERLLRAHAAFLPEWLA